MFCLYFFFVVFRFSFCIFWYLSFCGFFFFICSFLFYLSIRLSGVMLFKSLHDFLLILLLFETFVELLLVSLSTCRYSLSLPPSFLVHPWTISWWMVLTFLCHGYTFRLSLIGFPIIEIVVLVKTSFFGDKMCKMTQTLQEDVICMCRVFFFFLSARLFRVKFL